MVDRIQLYNAYDAVKLAVQSGYGSNETGQKIIDLAVIALWFLHEDCESVDLQSKVSGKEYISFTWNDVLARPVNRAYFTNSPGEIVGCWQHWASGGNLGRRSVGASAVHGSPCALLGF